MSLALLFALAAAAASPAPSPEEEAVRALRRYHAGLEAGDPARVLEVLGPTYFIADERTPGSERLWRVVGDIVRDIQLPEGKP